MKKIIVAYLLITLFQLVQNRGYGQSEIGISGGVHKSGFYGRQTTYFKPTYMPYWSYAAAVYYKEPISTKLFAGFELENIHIQSNLDFAGRSGIAYVYTYNALLDLDYINLHFLFGGNFFSIKQTTIAGTVSPYFGYLLHSKAVGHGSKSVPGTYTDSLGQTHDMIWSVPYEIHETKPQEIRKANVGLRLNINATIPLHKQLSLLLNASYHLGIYGVASEDAFVGIRGYTFSVGVTYKLDKKYLHFTEWEKYAKPKPH